MVRHARSRPDAMRILKLAKVLDVLAKVQISFRDTPPFAGRPFKNLRHLVEGVERNDRAINLSFRRRKMKPRPKRPVGWPCLSWLMKLARGWVSAAPVYAGCRTVLPNSFIRATNESIRPGAVRALARKRQIVARLRKGRPLQGSSLPSPRGLGFRYTQS